MKTRVLTAAILAAAGCATQVEKIAYTESGKPEVTIKTEDFAAVKTAIVSDMVRHDYVMDSESETLLTFSRPTQGGEDYAAALSIGNAYSSNRRVTKVMLIRQPGAVRVIMTPSLTAQLPGGQINTMDLSKNHTVFNLNQQDLIDIKAALEGTAKK